MNPLRMYARNRKLPQAVKLGTVSHKWIDYAYNLARCTPNSNEQALSQRVEQNILGTEITNYDTLTEFYNQRYINDLRLPDEIEKLQGVHHLRFGVLEHNSVIPFHLDEPYTLRFVCMISGTHRFYFDTGAFYDMTEGELWFINGSYRHSVENTTDGTRIALLGKFEHCETNIKLLNELL